MLNGWDVLAIVLVIFGIYLVINQIIMGILAAKAIKKIDDKNIPTSELFDSVNKEVSKAVDKATETVKKECKKKKEVNKEVSKTIGGPYATREE